tara:strand:- start:1797 stop:2357 length:561 start_codon:yes stop_codon:yes gene_type:complete
MNKIPKKWELVDDRLHAKCRIFEVRSQHFRHPIDGREGDFYVLNTSDWVNVLAITPAEEIVMVRQFRYGSRELSLETPGGVIEKGEDPVIAGLRELLEETGFAGKSARLISECRPNSAILSNRCHIVLAENVEKVAEVDFDPNEEIETVLIPIAKISDLVRSGEISHSLALNAIFNLFLEKGLPSA